MLDHALERRLAPVSPAVAPTRTAPRLYRAGQRGAQAASTHGRL